MANQKVAAYAAASSVTGASVFYVTDAGGTVDNNATGTQIGAFISSIYGIGYSYPAALAVATSNLTLSGEQTIDGSGPTSNSFVLLTGQTAGAENGLWTTASGAWTRPTWFATGSTPSRFGTVLIRTGTTYSGSVWRLTTAAVTVDTTAQTWLLTTLSVNATTITGGVTGTGAVVLATAPTFASTVNIAGTTTIGDNTAATDRYLQITGVAGNASQILFMTGNSLRWAWGRGSAAESGSNAGSGMQLLSYSDTGVFIDAPIAITRAVNGTISIGVSASQRPISLVGGTYADPPGTTQGVSVSTTFTASSDNASQCRSLQITSTFTPASTFTFSSSANRGLGVNLVNNGAGILTTAITGIFSFSNTSTGTITTGFGIQIGNGTNSGGGTVTNDVGLDIANQTVGTNNTNLLIGTTSAPTGSFSIHNASTNDNVHRGNTRFGSVTAPSAVVHIGGNTLSVAAWTTNGIRFRADGNTYTDTTSSGTVPNVSSDTFAAITIAASSATTYTDAATLNITAAPVAGSGVTITNGYGLKVSAGGMKILGITNINVSNNTVTNIGTGTTTSTISIGGGANTVAIGSGTGGTNTIQGATTINTSTNAVTNIGTGTTTSAVNIGGSGNAVNISSVAGGTLGFHAATAVVQRVGAAQAAVITTASTNVTPFGYATQAQADAIVTLVDELRAALVELGLIKGSA